MTREPEWQEELARWLRHAYGQPAGCPPPETYLAAELAVLPAAERRRVEEHAAACPACAGELELARAFDVPPAQLAQDSEAAAIAARLEAASPVADGSAGVKVLPWSPGAGGGRPSRWRRPSWLPLAAAAVLAVAIGVATQVARRDSPPGIAGPAAADVARGSTLRAVAPRDEQPEAPRELVWEAHAEAVRYRIVIRDVRERSLWEAEFPAPPAEIAAEVRERLQPAVVYTWRVEALNEGGARIAASQEVAFRIAPQDSESPRP